MWMDVAVICMCFGIFKPHAWILPSSSWASTYLQCIFTMKLLYCHTDIPRKSLFWSLKDKVPLLSLTCEMYDNRTNLKNTSSTSGSHTHYGNPCAFFPWLWRSTSFRKGLTIPMQGTVQTLGPTWKHDNHGVGVSKVSLYLYAKVGTIWSREILFPWPQNCPNPCHQGKAKFCMTNWGPT